MIWKAVLIEDEDLLRNGLIRAIAWDKYHFEMVGDADNGLDGLDMIRKEKPDLILTDIRMPKMDGLTMAERVHEELPMTKIVFITSYDEFDYAMRALKIGAVDYILKPIMLDQVEEILEKIRQELERTHLRNLEYERFKQNEASAQSNDQLAAAVSESDSLSRAITYLNQEYKNENLKIGDVAKYAFISSSYLSSLLKKETGKTFIEYLTDIRMQHAKVLLDESKMKNYEIAEACGFANATYFSTVFKNVYGISPSSYRKVREEENI